MSTMIKAASLAVTAALIAVAIAIGGGVPLSPTRLARDSRQAAENAQAAAANTARAARDTRALADIASDVSSQLRTSRRLLHIQLRIEASSRRGAARSKDVAAALKGIETVLGSLRTRLAGLARYSSRSVDSANRTAHAAAGLNSAIRRLRQRFRVVVKQSRRLNRKARGFSRLRGLLP